MVYKTDKGVQAYRKKILAVPCPPLGEGCGAEAGKRCRYLDNGVPGKEQQGFHGARELAAFGIRP